MKDILKNGYRITDIEEVRGAYRYTGKLFVLNAEGDAYLFERQLWDIRKDFKNALAGDAEPDIRGFE